MVGRTRGTARRRGLGRGGGRGDGDHHHATGGLHIQVGDFEQGDRVDWAGMYAVRATLIDFLYFGVRGRFFLFFRLRIHLPRRPALPGRRFALLDSPDGEKLGEEALGEHKVFQGGS